MKQKLNTEPNQALDTASARRFTSSQFTFCKPSAYFAAAATVGFPLP
jgi:hypothetical protein